MDMAHWCVNKCVEEERVLLRVGVCVGGPVCRGERVSARARPCARNE